MPTYKNVSGNAIDFVTTGHMEPGEVKSLADVIDHPDLQRVDDSELETLQATEPSNDQAPLEATLTQPSEQAAPAAPVAEPAVPQPQAPAQPTVVQPVQPAAPVTNVNPQGA